MAPTEVVPEVVPALKIACCQIKCLPADADGNLARALGALDRARESQPEVIVLPEAWPSGFNFGDVEGCHVASEVGIAALKRWSENWDGILVGGSMIHRDGDKVFNELVVIQRGQIIATYRKMHLFAGLGEHEVLTAGDQLALIDTPIGKAGLALCYDLRFPELFRHLARGGAKLLIVPSQWPGPRIEHWRLLARARAVENLCYFVGVNTAGISSHDLVYGHSLVVDPWGEIVWEAGQEQVVETVTIDAGLIESCRERLPAARDTRPDLLPPRDAR